MICDKSKEYLHDAGRGGGGGKLTLQYLPVSLIVKDKSKIKLFSKLPSTVLKSHYSKPINSRDFQLRNSEKYFWNVIVSKDKPIRCEKTKPQAGMAKRLLFVCMS